MKFGLRCFLVLILLIGTLGSSFGQLTPCVDCCDETCTPQECANLPIPNTPCQADAPVPISFPLVWLIAPLVLGIWMILADDKRVLGCSAT